jgi:hypothetical protein
MHDPGHAHHPRAGRAAPVRRDAAEAGAARLRQQRVAEAARGGGACGVGQRRGSVRAGRVSAATGRQEQDHVAPCRPPWLGLDPHSKERAAIMMAYLLTWGSCRRWKAALACAPGSCPAAAAAGHWTWAPQRPSRWLPAPQAGAPGPETRCAGCRAAAAAGWGRLRRRAPRPGRTAPARSWRAAALPAAAAGGWRRPLQSRARRDPRHAKQVTSQPHMGSPWLDMSSYCPEGMMVTMSFQI